MTDDTDIDVIVEFIGSITEATLKLYPRAWEELKLSEDNVMKVMNFLDGVDEQILMVYVNRLGKLELSDNFIGPIPKKVIYFFKCCNPPLSVSNYKQQLMCCTLSSKPVKQYQAIYEKVMIPILENPKNYKSIWPHYVAKDIIIHIKDFEKVLYNFVGQTQGKTLLPVPEIETSLDLCDIESLTSESLSDSHVRQLLSIIETMVIDWTRQINEVIEQSSDQCLTEGGNLGILTEITFWNERKDNLAFIFHQMKDHRVRNMATILEKTNSCFLSSFRNLFCNVVNALTEAKEVALHLESLEMHLKDVENCEFSELQEILNEVMPLITTSWSGSKFFSSLPSRISVLMQKMCNLFIHKACAYLNSADLFTAEREISQQKVELTLKTLNSFIDVYYTCRETMTSLFEHAKVYPWEFPDERVFFKLKRFLQRLEDIFEIFETAKSYNQLSNFKIIGIKQHSLCIELKDIFVVFCKQYETFSCCSYDILDIDDKGFENDRHNFHLKIKDLDCRLGAEISQGCLACPTIEESFKLLKILNKFLQRLAVKQELTACAVILIERLREELLKLKLMYDEQVNSAKDTGHYIIYKNMPFVSGIFQWSFHLKEKMQFYVTSLKCLEEDLLTFKDAQLIYQMHEDMLQLLSKLEEKVSSKWVIDVPKTVDKIYGQPLLIQDSKLMFYVNFNPQVVEIPQEVRHMRQLNQMYIPEEAISFSNQSEHLRSVYCILLLVVDFYNNLLNELVPNEKGLIYEQLQEINNLLDKGINELFWGSDGVLEYAEILYKKTKAVYDCVKQAKENIKEVEALMETWCNKPLYMRETPTAVVDFTIYMTRKVIKHYASIKKTGMLMHIAMKNNQKLFNCDPNTLAWFDYVNYLESILINGLTNFMKCSLQYLMKNTNSEDEQLVKMNLKERYSFVPPLEEDKSGSLIKQFEAVTDMICSAPTQINRLNEKNDFMSIMKGYNKYVEMTEIIKDRVSQAAAKAISLADEYDHFAELWEQDIEISLKYFLLYGPPPEPTDNEIEDEVVINEEKEQELKAPTEEEFRTTIDRFEMAHDLIEGLEAIKPVESWIILDVTPFKENLITLIRQWSSAYKQSLIEQKSSGKLRKIVKQEE